ncbi:hypothetical protein P154DRAFT_525259 [Amniculicola lignicola CBS 123094]|uniref:DC-UbP/UBTD2 N-terminal domain-containing protein n=1 Tax=Amniculicola lignicola CBS 123094 TaxID=1392246 RepID=A0A6A5W7I2_9PLEO|nr:hypothetical protein P154DRAFT_525259 [Amniculicola lignicola CBS 123094]
MGCCASREAVDDGTTNPYPQVADAHNPPPDSSRRNITAPSPRGSQSRPDVPNVPLRPIPAEARCPLPSVEPSTSPSGHRQRGTLLSQPNAPWTRSRLDKERKDWWDTRITGNTEIWIATRAIVEHVQKGEMEDAQALLDALACTCPTGEVWRGVFDEHGVWYKVPEWIVIEPEGLVDDDEEESIGGKEIEAGGGSARTEDERMGPVVKVRCRLSSTAKDYVIEMRPKDKLEVLIHRLREATGIRDKKLKAAFLGIIYQDSQTLDAHPRWTEGAVLNIMVYG